jgi:hypothetical protein
MMMRETDANDEQTRTRDRLLPSTLSSGGRALWRARRPVVPMGLTLLHGREVRNLLLLRKAAWRRKHTGHQRGINEIGMD